MPLTPHDAHRIGAIGELLNFAGAVVLAADLFLRQRKENEAKLLDPLGAWTKKSLVGNSQERTRKRSGFHGGNRTSRGWLSMFVWLSSVLSLSR
jgi:hypothetical protein